MLHRCLPQTFTPENLAKWIQDNAAETIIHTEKIELEEEQVQELEKQSSLASRAIDRLENIKEKFMEVLNGGTPDVEAPFDITIPPTKGLKVLKANRKFADMQIEQGYKEEETQVFVIPYPEDSLMVGVTIEGEEFSQYTKEMSIEQINQHKPILKKDKKKKKEEDSFMEDETTSALELDL